MAEWRYLKGGRVVHALSYIDEADALCGMTARPSADEWRGTGSQAEYERAAALPKCPRCLATVGRRHG